jgi:hypothetical protein
MGWFVGMGGEDKVPGSEPSPQLIGFVGQLRQSDAHLVATHVQRHANRGRSQLP